MKKFLVLLPILFLWFPNVSHAALTTNLVSYYKLDGNSNDAVSTNNGTDTDITYSASYGKINQGALFNGSTSKITVPNLGIGGSTARSVSFWVKRGASTTIRTLYYNGGSTAVDLDHFIIHCSGNSTGDIYVGFGNDDYYTVGGVIDNTAFYNVTVIFDGGTPSTSTVHVYVNDVSESLTKVGGATGVAATTDANYSFGYDILDTGNTRHFDGDMDEIGVWSRALTSTEVAQLYNGGAGLQYPFTIPWILSSWIHWIL